MTGPVLRTGSAPNITARLLSDPESVQGDRGADLRELAIVATFPALYWVASLFLSVQPTYDPVTTLGGPVVVVITVVAMWGAWKLRPRPGVGGRWRFPQTHRSLFHALLAHVAATRWHWIRGTLLLALAVTFLDVYAAYKQAIPRFASYTWDPLLSDLDRWVHGGLYPWHVLQPIIESRLLVLILDRVYWLWSGVSILFVGIAAWSPDRRCRIQFMLTFYATWIIGGTMMAIALASGGPAYFAVFAPEAFNPYESLVRTLHGMDGLTAVTGHHLLWHGFSEGGHPRASGISAMPSLHVAMATLCALLASTFNRMFAGVTVVYAGLIVVGSVVLAWHYAIDAYVSIGLVLLLWWLAGRVVDRIGTGE